MQLSQRQNDRLATPDNRGPIIDVTSWIVLVIAILAALVKIGSKWLLIRKLGLDDAWIFLSMVTAIGYTVAVNYQVDAGLGRRLSTMSVDQIEDFGRAAYASDFLYILSIGFAKMALLQFLLTLARSTKRGLVTKSVIVFNALSCVSALFPVAFQCSLPRPWDILGGQCINRVAFWIAFGVQDIILDIATIALPVYLLHDLQVRTAQRWNAIVAFISRIVMIPVIAVRLYFIVQGYNSVDEPFNDYGAAVASNVHVSVSIITTCIPFLRPIMDSLQSGVLAMGPRTGEGGVSSYRLSELSKKMRSPTASKGYGEGSRMSRVGEPQMVPEKKKRPSGDSDERLIHEIHKQTVVSIHFEDRTSQHTDDNAIVQDNIINGRTTPTPHAL